MRHKVNRKFLILLGVMFLASFSIIGADCEEGNKTLQEQRADSINTRAESFSRAENQHPVPRNENFPIRDALVEFTIRQDLVNHPWYTYIFGDNGNVIGYYVTKTGPINSCNFLSSTEEVRDGGKSSDIILTAPSIDGIYYGGGGSQGSCDKWFFFDYTTNAMIEIRGLNFFTSDRPLLINAEPIRVQQ